MRVPSIEHLRDALEYDPETGVLKWKPKQGGTPQDARWNGRNAGMPATCLNTHGYIHISFTDPDGNRFKLRAHRVIFAIVEGRWPVLLDHRNGVRTDNRWENLRDTDTSGNNRNRRAVLSASGFKGVCRRDRSDNWHAQITVEDKAIHLGAFGCPKQAAQAYDRAAVKHFGQFAMTNAGMGLL